MSEQNTKPLNPIALTLARLADLGCTDVDEDAVADAWRGPFHAELEFCVGGRLSSGLTNIELEEFGALLDRDAGDDASAAWLAEYAPDYPDVVREELTGLIDESELSRVAIAPTVFKSDPEAHDTRTILAEPVAPRPTFAAPTADGWDSTAYVLKLMAQADGEIWTWTDLAPAGHIEQQMVVDELSTIYIYAGMGRNTGTVVRARTVIAGTGVVPPMVRSGLGRRSRELRLLPLDPTAAERLWADPVSGSSVTPPARPMRKPSPASPGCGPCAVSAWRRRSAPSPTVRSTPCSRPRPSRSGSGGRRTHSASTPTSPSTRRSAAPLLHRGTIGQREDHSARPALLVDYRAGHQAIWFDLPRRRRRPCSRL